MEETRIDGGRARSESAVRADVDVPERAADVPERPAERRPSLVLVSVAERRSLLVPRAPWPVQLHTLESPVRRLDERGARFADTVTVAARAALSAAACAASGPCLARAAGLCFVTSLSFASFRALAASRSTGSSIASMASSSISSSDEPAESTSSSPGALLRVAYTPGRSERVRTGPVLRDWVVVVLVSFENKEGWPPEATEELQEAEAKEEVRRFASDGDQALPLLPLAPRQEALLLALAALAEGSTHASALAVAARAANVWQSSPSCSPRLSRDPNLIRSMVLVSTRLLDRI